jgi:hypothetical protein
MLALNMALSDAAMLRATKLPLASRTSAVTILRTWVPVSMRSSWAGSRNGPFSSRIIIPVEIAPLVLVSSRCTCGQAAGFLLSITAALSSNPERLKVIVPPMTVTSAQARCAEKRVAIRALTRSGCKRRFPSAGEVAGWYCPRFALPSPLAAQRHGKRWKTQPSRAPSTHGALSPLNFIPLTSQET